MEERLVKISRTMAYALRHHPEEFDLTLDEEGWVPVEELLAALRKRGSLHDVSADDFAAIIARSDKKRYEMQGGKIRAFYGHSVAQKMAHQPAMPPDQLFHGTTRNAARVIEREGLKPMNRQYVHLSADRATARIVALRRTSRPVIFSIDARQAYKQGVAFYDGNDQVWLAENVPAQFLRVISEGE